MFRIIKEVRPAWVLGENVAGIVNMELDNVLSDLESEGYETQAFIIPACSVDAKHRRNRVWILANSNGKRLEGQRSEQQTTGIVGESKDVANTGCELWNERNATDMEATEKKRSSCILHNQPSGERQPEFLANTNGEGIQRRKVAGSIKERRSEGKKFIMRFGEGGANWSTKSRLGGMVDGISTRMDGYWEPEPTNVPRTAKGTKNRMNRLKGLGNAIVPQVAYEIFKAIIEIESGKL